FFPADLSYPLLSSPQQRLGVGGDGGAATVRRFGSQPPSPPRDLVPLPSPSFFPPRIRQRGGASVAVRPEGSEEAVGSADPAAARPPPTGFGSPPLPFLPSPDPVEGRGVGGGWRGGRREGGSGGWRRGGHRRRRRGWERRPLDDYDEEEDEDDDDKEAAARSGGAAAGFVF
ncbi:Os08g0423400, partial [Oryza sativa Japonica Group]